MRISVITPWLGHPELCGPYARSVRDADEVIVIDNASPPPDHAALEAMVERLPGGRLITNEENRLFAPANNQGLAAATGDIVLFLNDDCLFRSDLRALERVPPDALCGPSWGEKHGEGYIEGHCIAGRWATWEMLGGWPDDLPGMYWEDNILCLTALRQGMRLLRTDWRVWHPGNTTSAHTPGAYDHSGANEREYVRLLQQGGRRWRS